MLLGGACEMDLESQSTRGLEEGVLKIKVVENVQPYKISLHIQPLFSTIG